MAARAIPLVVLASLPWILLAFNAEWVYSDTGLLDAWLYHGFFHRFDQFAQTNFGVTYYATRLAWIVPGYAAYHLLPPHAANVLLHVSFFYATIAALYRAAAILTNRSAALISTCAFATATPTIVAFGWDYIDGAVITYLVVALWAVVEASISSRRVLLLMTAGAAGACIVHSNLGAGLLGPTILIAYACTHSRKHWMDIAVMATGGVVITMVLGAISALAGGPFLFFMPSVLWATASLGTQPFVPVPPLRWPGSARFVLPLVGLAAAFGAYFRERTPATRTALFMMLWLVAAFIAYDWTFSAALLQTQYYVSWFLPLAFWSVAVALAPVRVSAGSAITIAAAVAVLQATALQGVPQALRLTVYHRLEAPLPELEVAAVAAVLLLTAIVSLRMRRTTQVLVIAVALVMSDFVVAPNLNFGPSKQGRSQFDAVQQTLSFIRDNVPPRSMPIFWIEGSSQRASYYHSLASTHLYLYSLFSSVYPKLLDNTKTLPRGAGVRRGDYFLVVADDRVNDAAIEAEFKPLGMRAEVVRSTAVRTERVSFVLTLLHIR
jgi:hypothetical protein